MIKYFEEPFKNVECLQNDTLNLKVEVANKIEFFASSIEPDKLANGFHNNAEVNSEKTFCHRAIANLRVVKNHTVLRHQFQKHIIKSIPNMVKLPEFNPQVMLYLPSAFQQ